MTFWIVVFLALVTYRPVTVKNLDGRQGRIKLRARNWSDGDEKEGTWGRASGHADQQQPRIHAEVRKTVTFMKTCFQLGNGFLDPPHPDTGSLFETLNGWQTEDVEMGL